MNYNLNTFVIAIGEHLATIAYNAPWMNNQPINHGQAYRIFSALHEELFNEIFPWARIDNSVQEAVAEVYTGYAALVAAKPKLWRQQAGSWVMVSDSAAMGAQVIDLQPGQGLPRYAVNNALYRVHGGKSYADWLSNFVDNTLGHVRWSLRNELNKYLGTSRNYEWYFDYSGNGILYTRQGMADVKYIQPELPTTEIETIHQEIAYLPKAEEPIRDVMIVDLTGSESRGSRGSVDKFAALLQQVPKMVSDFCYHILTKGAQRGEILIRYRNPLFMQDLAEALAQLIRNVPVQLTIKSEQITVQSDILSHAEESMKRALAERSLAVIEQQDHQIAEQLRVIRDRIVKRNGVTDLDISEINSLDNTLLTQAHYNDDAYSAVRDPRQWYKFNNVDPTELQQPVVALALLLSNHIDTLLGNQSSNQPIPIYEPRRDDGLIAAIPLYGK